MHRINRHDDMQSFAAGRLTEADKPDCLQALANFQRGLYDAVERNVRGRVEIEYEAAGLDLVLLQFSPQYEEMDRFAAQVIRAH